MSFQKIIVLELDHITKFISNNKNFLLYYFLKTLVYKINILFKKIIVIVIVIVIII
jgi:hypothetical protein